MNVEKKRQIGWRKDNVNLILTLGRLNQRFPEEKGFFKKIKKPIRLWRCNVHQPVMLIK